MIRLTLQTGKERRERELQEALRKAEEEQRLHQQLEEATQIPQIIKWVYTICECTLTSCQS